MFIARGGGSATLVGRKHTLTVGNSRRCVRKVGGRLSDVFDEDPKRWRMLAETLATLGLSLEIATSFSPSKFVAPLLRPGHGWASSTLQL